MHEARQTEGGGSEFSCWRGQASMGGKGLMGRGEDVPHPPSYLVTLQVMMYLHVMLPNIPNIRKYIVCIKDYSAAANNTIFFATLGILNSESKLSSDVSQSGT